MLRGAIYSTLVTAILSTLCHHCGWFLQLSTLSNIYTPVTRVKFKATNNCAFIQVNTFPPWLIDGAVWHNTHGKSTADYWTALAASCYVHTRPTGATDEDIAQHKAVDSSSPVKSAAAISWVNASVGTCLCVCSWTCVCMWAHVIQHNKILLNDKMKICPARNKKYPSELFFQHWCYANGLCVSLFKPITPLETAMKSTFLNRWILIKEHCWC